MSEEVDKNNLVDNYKKNQDLENYFANTIIPQLFIDGNLLLKKFTPPAMKQFSLTEEDRSIRCEELTIPKIASAIVPSPIMFYQAETGIWDEKMVELLLYRSSMISMRVCCTPMGYFFYKYLF